MNKKPDDYKHIDRQLTKAFKECFSTPAGAMVLHHLREEFYDGIILYGDAAEFKLGARHVLFSILERVDQDE